MGIFPVKAIGPDWGAQPLLSGRNLYHHAQALPLGPFNQALGLAHNGFKDPTYTNQRLPGSFARSRSESPDSPDTVNLVAANSSRPKPSALEQEWLYSFTPNKPRPSSDPI